MTSRERVLKALNHEEPDRVPKDLGATNATGINWATYDRLLKLLGLREEIEIIDVIQGLARVSPAVKQRLGIDTYGLWPRGSSKAVKEKGYTPEGGEFFIDEWGFYWLKPKGGLYFDVWKNPLRDIDPRTFELDSYDWPDPSDLARLDGLREEAQKTRAETEFAIVLGETLDFFLFCCWLRGFDNFMMDLYLNPDFARQLLERVNHIQMLRVENTLRNVGDLVDVVGVIGDDWGMQDRLYVSQDLFNGVFRAGIENMVTMIRKYTDAPIFAHSCGAIDPLIPDFIKIGFNVLNPIQTSAKGMSDTAELKRKYGHQLTFWGGGVDTQRVLNRGSLADIEQEVQERIADLAPGGGFVFCPVHNIQADVPPENIVHAYELVERWGRYPIAPADGRKGRPPVHPSGSRERG
jgi:uroporphyrinogen decarboxylase